MHRISLAIVMDVVTTSSLLVISLEPATSCQVTGTYNNKQQQMDNH
jgi:hypothetical protein